MLHPTILAGGSGTRFWPKSRSERPKQFLAFRGSRTLLEQTFERLRGVADAAHLRVITSAAHAGLTRKLLPDLRADQVIGEPEPRDTAAAVGLAAVLAEHRDPDAKVLVAPADQHIEPREAFQAAVRQAETLLDERPESVVVFGVTPTGPATGYGYVERGEAWTGSGSPAHEVKSFREKPDPVTARELLASGGFYWNAGIFAFRAAAMRALIARHLPELESGLAELAKHAGTDAFEERMREIYPRLPRISIDFGVMERCRDRLLIPVEFAWDDVGSWPALARHLPVRAGGNVESGAVLALDARQNIVDAGDGLVALIGVDDLVVVHTADVTLVCARDQAERVKEILEQLRTRPGGERYL